MDQDTLSSTSVLAMLLETNRPPTDREKAIILEYMAPAKAELKQVEEKISEQIALIEELKSQVKQAKNKLRRLEEEEAVILDTFADHDRVFSPFRNLPDDVLREICVSCVQGDIPELLYGQTSMPYILSQICSGMRHVALTTPLIWASMSVETKSMFFHRKKPHELEIYAILARKATDWFERAGGVGLTVIIEDSREPYETFLGGHSDPTHILFDALISYSARWKEIQLFSYGRRNFPSPMARIVDLTAAHVPLLQSVSFFCDESVSNSVLHNSQLLTVPTLRHLTLETRVRMFFVNWIPITSITLHGDTKIEIGKILQQTKCLVFCDIFVHFSNEHYDQKIDLPFLKTLIVKEVTSDANSSGAYSILEAITAPLLEIFENRIAFWDLSLSNFLKRSPHIWKFSVVDFDKNKSLTNTVEFLRHCPSLMVLSLQAHRWRRGTAPRDFNSFLRAFIEEGTEGVICPRLQVFTHSGRIDFSLETLQIFLEGKRRDIAALNVLPWKEVVIDLTGIIYADKRQQISAFVSQQKRAGLDVRVYATTRCMQ